MMGCAGRFSEKTMDMADHDPVDDRDGRNIEMKPYRT